MRLDEGAARSLDLPEARGLIVVDVEMPGMNGFELLARLSWQPPVIFTTAYDEYALRAFEVNALDYLLKPIEPALLARARALGLHVIHTREGHRPDLSDLPANKRWRSQRIGAGIGDAGPCGRILVRGEPGWQIIDELAPLPGEPIIDKPGKGSFCATDLELLLHTRGIRNLILTGITTDVCVAFAALSALDAGFEVYVVTDASGSMSEQTQLASLMRMQEAGAIMGTWFALSCEMLYDWRNPKGQETAQLFVEHFPAYAEIFHSHQAHTKKK